jgi:hypothetical protein
MKERTSLRPTELAELAIEWWCPDRYVEIYGELTSRFVRIMDAYDSGDLSTWYNLLNGAAVSVLGYDLDDEDQEEALLGYLEDLCRGYFDPSQAEVG